LLSFGTAWILIEIMLALFHSSNERLKTFLMLLPFIKLPIDLFRYDFGGWAVPRGIDPALGEPGTRVISASVDFFPVPSLDLGFHMENGPTFSLMDFALSHVTRHPFGIKCMILFFIGCSLTLLSLRIRHLRKENLRLGAVIERSALFHPRLENGNIRSRLEGDSIALLLTKEAKIPFAAFWEGKKCIVFPETLIRQLNREEIEAVIAHELGHIFWSDPKWQRGLQILRCLFFWVPMNGLIKRMQRQREYACDRFAMRLGASSCALASALMKTAKAALGPAPSLAAPLASKSCLRKRIECLLQEKTKWSYAQSAALLILCSGLVLGKLWIF
jgi:hypothetical protein